jgi:mRNA export factor
MPIKCIKFFEPAGSHAPMAVTGSWDKTIKYWDLRTPNAVGTIDCGERIYSLDVKKDTLVIATASNEIHIVNLRDPGRILETRKSPLTHQLRVVTLAVDGDHFAVGSIEGRVGYQRVSGNETS